MNPLTATAASASETPFASKKLRTSATGSPQMIFARASIKTCSRFIFVWRPRTPPKPSPPRKCFHQRTFLRADDHAGIYIVPREPAVAGLQNKLDVVGRGQNGVRVVLFEV